MKLYRVNLTQKTIKMVELTKNHPLFKYAGRALSSKIIADEVLPATNALDGQNKLIFATGFLSGTTAPNSGRISVGCKSPLTTGVKEANVGGRAPGALQYNGSMDEIKIYNHSLSAEQVYENYQAGFSGRNSQVLKSNETSVDEQWHCEVTPNDGNQDGTNLNSTAVTISSSGQCSPNVDQDWEITDSQTCEVSSIDLGLGIIKIL